MKPKNSHDSFKYIETAVTCIFKCAECIVIFKRLKKICLNVSLFTSTEMNEKGIGKKRRLEDDNDDDDDDDADDDADAAFVDVDDDTHTKTTTKQKTYPKTRVYYI